MVEEAIKSQKKGEEENSSINNVTPLGSLTLVGSLIAIHIYDYLKNRESSEAEA